MRNQRLNFSHPKYGVNWNPMQHGLLGHE